MILLLIPIVILVRIFVRTSRWSILKMSCIAISGTLLLSSWLFYASLITGNNLGGEWGRFLGQRMAENLGDGTTFYLLSASLIIWIITACMDLIVSGARYFINKPYIREIVVEVQKELEDEEKEKKGPKTKTPKPKKPVHRCGGAPGTAFWEISRDERRRQKVLPAAPACVLQKSHRRISAPSEQLETGYP